MRLKLIGCELLSREIKAAVERSSHSVDVEFLPKGLHDQGGSSIRERLQAVIDQVDESAFDAVILGYALCGNGLAGITARGIPVVIPRGHDCITLLLGNKDRYLEYFRANPGVYFKSAGWIEYGSDLEQLTPDSYRHKTGVNLTYEQLVSKYGEDNAKYLFEQLGNYTKNYSRLTFIEMGIEPDDRFLDQSREEAARRGMAFEKVQGDMGLLERLADGAWGPEEFLVVPPGWRVVPKYDEGIIAAEIA